MAASFYFYDLETSGFNPRSARIMQFGGQRTDLQLKPVGEPHDILIKMTSDVLPDADAILVTGITPQMTIADGITEAEFLKLFYEEIATPDTIFVGFNSIRFDDEFMRYLNYRNFYDPYAWAWDEGRSRWDILDVLRMTRALRPEGIKWPVDTEGKPSNRLELLTGINKLDHVGAHNALSDVNATIAVARMVYNKQTKLFNYLLSMRDKKKISALVEANQPFVYTSGKYASEYEKTTVAVKLADHPKNRGVLVYDLRVEPSQFTDLTPAQIVDLWRWKPYKEGEERPPKFPVKTLQYNKCPAVAPLGVLDDASKDRLKIDMAQIEANHKKLKSLKKFKDNLLKAVELLDKEQQTSFLSAEQDVDAQLYDGFFADADKIAMSAVRAAEPSELSSLQANLKDERLKTLLPLYKARNFPKKLDDSERAAWDQFVHNKLLGGKHPTLAERYFARLEELAKQPRLTDNKCYLLEELQLYGQSILPEPD